MFIKVALQNLRRNLRRSILSSMGVIVASFTIICLFGFIGGMLNNITDTTVQFVSGDIQIQNTEYEKFERINPLYARISDNSKTLERTLEIKTVIAAAPRIDFSLNIYKNDKLTNYHAVGMDFKKEISFSNFARYLEKGTLPAENSREVLIGTGLAKQFNLDIGSKFTAFTQTASLGSNGLTFTVSGIAKMPVSNFNTQTVFMPYKTAQYFVQLDGSTKILLLSSDVPSSFSSLQKTFKDDNLSIKQWTQVSTLFSYVQIAKVVYSFIALFFFLLASTVIINTSMVVILERKKEIGTLSALGMSTKELKKLFFYESFFIALAGSIIGSLLGSILMIILHTLGLDLSTFTATSDYGTEISNVIKPTISVGLVLIITLYSIVVSSLITLLPLRKITQLTPAEALR